MAKDLKARKQELVRETIFDAAIELFLRNGFNETTVDQIVDAAGISQRSFFRYFATKGELLGYRIPGYGNALISAVAQCPSEVPALEVMRRAALAGIEYANSDPRTLQIIEITAQNIAARQAHRAAMVEVEIRLSDAFASRAKGSGKFNLEPRMLTRLTLMVGDLALSSWYVGEAKDSLQACRDVFSRVTRLFCESTSPATAKATQRKRSTRQFV